MFPLRYAVDADTMRRRLQRSSAATLRGYFDPD
jgi:hypothetical protein